MPALDSLQRAYQFLLRHAKSQKPFSPAELGAAAGWENSTPRTYLAKQLKSVVDGGRGAFRVKRNFVHLREEHFLRRTSQKEYILPTYVRTSFDSVLCYEFLMPLTREDLLRQALDRLFFKDTLIDQIKLVGLDSFKAQQQRKPNQSDDEYATVIASLVAKYFGGYSMTHVNGRYRVKDLLTQNLAIGERYVIDETTAIVRFIIPLSRTSTQHGEIFDPRQQRRESTEAVSNEVSLIRALFFTIFAEVVVHSVQGEDEIWLLETLEGAQRLYKWEVVAYD